MEEDDEYRRDMLSAFSLAKGRGSGLQMKLEADAYKRLCERQFAAAYAAAQASGAAFKSPAGT